MTTDAAFKTLVDDKALWEKTGLSARARNRYSQRLANNKAISEDKKSELLQAAGFIEIPMLWNEPEH
jgi:hypothetical protein